MCIGATPEDVQALLAVVQAAAARLGGDVLQAILAVGHPKPVA